MTYLLSILIIFGLFAGWAAVQQYARRFAARHPELGPAREEGSGCGFPCELGDARNCPHFSGGSCHLPLPREPANPREEAP